MVPTGHQLKAASRQLLAWCLKRALAGAVNAPQRESDDMPKALPAASGFLPPSNRLFGGLAAG